MFFSSKKNVEPSSEENYRSLLESYRTSSRLNVLQISDLQNENEKLEKRLLELETSLSWKVTYPLRVIRAFSFGRLPSGRPIGYISHRTKEIITKEGKKVFFLRVWKRVSLAGKIFVKKKRLIGKQSSQNVKIYTENVPKESKNTLSNQILIIAELSLRQCAKYRVWQKKELLQNLGWNVKVVDWRDIALAKSALQVCKHVIFYRVPGFDDVIRLVEEAHRLQLDPIWEVDDLIFDAEEYRQNGNIDTLSVEERDLILSGVALFRRCMLACGRGLASTRALADEMKKAGLQNVFVLENALDDETCHLVEEFLPSEHIDKEEIWVSYGSGTNTHDIDFKQAEKGLFSAMEEEKRLCLCVIGQLNLSEKFKKFGKRVKYIQELTFKDYLKTISQTDIAIAPLESTTFNACKSNIKYLEASILKVASICSPRDAFKVILRDGENGFFAETPDDWKNAFLKLARDNQLRRRLAEQAWKDVTSYYNLTRMAHTEGQKIFGLPQKSDREKIKVLLANIYFAPRSFGGATIVAEEMAYQLKKRDIDVSVFTSKGKTDDKFTSNVRYSFNGIDVFAVPILDEYNKIGSLDNPYIAEQFATWLDAYQPDVVHVHAAQGLGVSMLRMCQERGIPYVLTLHDAWWLCDRQFMVQENGRYCFQTKIDLKTCQFCQQRASYLEDRQSMMHYALKGAALLLSPSEAHRQLYLANGVEPERIVVNRNGFQWPSRPRKKRIAGAPVRFGFVGGTEVVKGYELLKECVESLSRSDWKLILVDNKINLGFQSIFPDIWNVRGTLEIIPAFNQNGLDDFFDQIDVLLFPSQWKESYGLTVREALARDVWVITTSPGGQSEDVIHGINGTHIPLSGDPSFLAQAMEDILQHPEFLSDYVNPLKADLASYETQAAELEEHLRKVVRDN
ncbi:glycosyltransferase [Swingsia samuiensis]|uniref:Glycosyltransferase n=1 Tax=Swingsia samuiensis TaxID=1293412 RepID=A0A4Y6UKP5_9PROT|nr:glycosyltransferase [Swingsia samuiensis]QDH16957.1 glycosyltransferase [Swingsia samuiensis]